MTAARRPSDGTEVRQVLSLSADEQQVLLLWMAKFLPGPTRVALRNAFRLTPADQALTDHVQEVMS